MSKEFHLLYPITTSESDLAQEQLIMYSSDILSTYFLPFLLELPLCSGSSSADALNLWHNIKYVPISPKMYFTNKISIKKVSHITFWLLSSGYPFFPAVLTTTKKLKKWGYWTQRWWLKWMCLKWWKIPSWYLNSHLLLLVILLWGNVPIFMWRKNMT